MKFPWAGLALYPRDITRARIKRVTKRMREMDFEYIPGDEFPKRRLQDIKNRRQPVVREQWVRVFRYLGEGKRKFIVEVEYDKRSGKVECEFMCILMRKHIDFVSQEARQRAYRKLCKEWACPSF